jgi:hypothetical protein
MHRGGGMTMGRWGRLGTMVFQWRGDSDDLWWLWGGPMARDGGERGEALVAWSEQKKRGGMGKAGDDEGGALLKG